MKFGLVILSLLLAFTVVGQSKAKHYVYFERGQASISLQQLDSIKALAKLSLDKTDGRIIVHTYANDALEGDLNHKLSGRRAYLIQQCLERAGVPLGYMQIKSKVQSTSMTTACRTCAEISITTDSNFFSQNVYQDQIAEFLREKSGIYAQTFWVAPFRDVVVTTKDGVLVQIPAGTLNTSDSALVKLDVRLIQTESDMLLHSLATRSQKQQFLDLDRAVHLEVSQYGNSLDIRANKSITVVVPSDLYVPKAQLYQQKEQEWVVHPQTNLLKAGNFYLDNGDCYALAGQDSLRLPQFAVPPAKPTLLHYDSMTLEQDKLLDNIQRRLDYLDEQKVTKRGKKQDLTSVQKRNELVLKNRKNRLLIAKEKIKIQTREENEAREAAYYKAVASYNQQRHQQQRTYLDGLDSIGGIQKAKMRRCAEFEKNVELLKQHYGQASYEQLTANLRNQAVKEQLGYWIQTQELGWLSFGQLAKRNYATTVPYRVKTPISAHKITAYLIFDKTQDVVRGETLDATDIVFWEVPDGAAAKVLAITQERDNFLVAFQELVTSGDPIELDFQPFSLRAILNLLK